MDHGCIVCGGSLKLLREGARYCGQTCKIRAYRRKKSAQEAIPAEMREQARWMRWELLKRRGKTTKRPVAVSGLPGSSTRAERWCDYAKARSSEIGHGIGFALGEGIGCIDLDDALDDAGVPLPWAQQILDAAPETFIEISQSGRGLHIFGHLTEGPGSNPGNGVEVYSAGRFIAMTGERFKESPSLLADLTALAAQIT